MQIPTIVSNTCIGFWTGWLAGSTLLAGGKLWCVLTNPETRTSELLGHIGKPSFRRQLAVGCAIFFATNGLFENLGKNLDINHRPSYRLITKATSIALGSLGAAATTHSSYTVMLYTVSAVSAAVIAATLYFD